LVYTDWVKRKQAEMLNWQIIMPDSDDDGGFPAEKPSDQAGVWTTSETLYTLLKYKILPPNDTRVQNAKAWLLRHRNLGGDYGDGWPLINRGNSFVDTTAMAIMALSFFAEETETLEDITKAKDWLLENQNDDGGWGIWKYEDSLVSATSCALLALKETSQIFKEEKINTAIQSGITWLKLMQNETSHLWGFSEFSEETNNASTCQALTALFALGEEPANYKDPLAALLTEFRENGTWHTIQENYTLKYFGEGLDQRLSWFNAPHVVSLLITYAQDTVHEFEIKQIIDAAESLKKFDAFYESREVTDISMGHQDIRPWASVQYLRGLLDAQAYLQEHLDEYVSVMSGKLAIIEKAGMLQSLPIVLSPKKQTSVYVSGKFLVGLFPAIGLSLLAVAYATHVTSLEIALIGSLFGMYLLTFFTLYIGFRQKVVSRSRFCYLYFPIWALIVLATRCFSSTKQSKPCGVAPHWFPEILHHIMAKSKAKTKRHLNRGKIQTQQNQLPVWRLVSLTR
jgi:hypothetical protein